MAGLLEITNLSVSFDTAQGKVQAVRGVSFSLQSGEVLAIVGESGCGKSVLCKTIMKLLPDTARINSGTIAVNGIDITRYREQDMRKLRGNYFSMVFQDPMTSLNPTIPIGRQIGEAVKIHNPGMTKAEVYQKVLELMELVGIGQVKERYPLYPYSFSGGMRQRSVMAIGLASNPKLLFADEPTTALDVTVQAQILDLIREIQKNLGTAMILVSHDLGVVARAADRVAVMYAGKIVEIGKTEEIFYEPCHPYTWGLMKSLPAFSKAGRELYTIPGMPPTLLHPPKGDAFACRNEYALAIDYEEEPPMFRVTDTHYAATWLLDKHALRIDRPQTANISSVITCQEINQIALDTRKEPSTATTSQKEPNHNSLLVDIQNLTHEFALSKKVKLRAVDNLSFQIHTGEVFGLVGESGSGKSTVARCLMNIYHPLGGKIFYKGINIMDSKQYQLNRKMLQTRRQIVFQDSTSSLNQRMKVSDIIAEPMVINRVIPPRGSWRAEAEFQLHYVGLDASYLDKYPSELSGGMRQRIAIARALSMEPELLVADEPIASLDVSIQAQILNLFKHLQQEHGFTFLFIAHDLSVVRYLCNRVGVMYQGKLVELAETEELFENPLHPYTKALISAIPIPTPSIERRRKLQIFQKEDFNPNGELRAVSPGHFVLENS
ncbi:MAG: ABC transporter ATP-binding protein [Hungatella sp.]|nr:ABC transporter ATP-binding protein [Hungatella sp.]